jgi:hypothetical protein
MANIARFLILTRKDEGKIKEDCTLNNKGRPPAPFT